MGTIIGLELGVHHLKLAAWNGRRIVGCYTAETPENLVSDGRIVSYDAAAEFIRTSVKKTGWSAKDAAVILPNKSVYFRRFRMPYMTHDKLMVNIPYEFQDFLASDKARFYYSYSIHDTVKNEDGKPSELVLSAAAVSKDLISEYRLMLRRAGLRLKYALPEEAAYSNLVEKFGNREEKRNICFLNSDAAYTRLDFFASGLYDTTRIIEKGLYSLDEILAEENNIDIHLARTYRDGNYREINESAPSAAFYSELALDIRRAVNFYIYSNQGTSLSDIILLGEGSRLEPLRSTIESGLEIPLCNAYDVFPSLREAGQFDESLLNVLGAAISEKGINLAQSDKKKLDFRILIPAAAGVLVLAALFSKFAVIDRYRKLDEANARLYTVENTQKKLTSELLDYDEVYSEFSLYSTGWMTDNEKILVKRDEIFKLIDSVIMSYGRVLSFSSAANSIEVNLGGLSLETTSRLVETLRARDDVVSVAVRNAHAEYADSEGQSDTTGVDSIVTISIQMRITEEADKQ